MAAPTTSRVIRGLLSGLACAVALAAATARAQENGGAADELEAVPTNGLQLVSGEFLAGKLLEEYWRAGAAEGEASEGIILLRADRTRLFIPFRYLSRKQNYLIYRAQLYPPDQAHPVFRPEDFKPRELRPDWLWTLADDALMANMWIEAKRHFDDCFALAEKLEGPARVEQLKPFLDKRLKELNIKVSTIDGRWVDEDTYYKEQGLEKFGDQWLKPEAIAELKRQAADAAKRSLTIDDPENYARAHLDLVRAFPGEWIPRGAAKTYFFARFHDQAGDKFTKVGKFGSNDYVKLRVTYDDCNHVYVSKKNKPLMDRLASFKRGTPMVLYGRLEVISGIVIFECEDLALR